MDALLYWLAEHNHDIAVYSFALLGLATMIVMFPSEWDRKEP